MVSENGFVPGFPGVGGRGTAPDFLGKFYHNTFPREFDWGVHSVLTDRHDQQTVQHLRNLKVHYFLIGVEVLSKYPF